MDERIIDFLIGEDFTIENAIERLNRTSQRALYVVDENSRLLGSFADGDMRRGFLKGVDIKEEVSKVYNRNVKFITVAELDEIEMIKDLMSEYYLNSLPVIDENEIVKDIIFWSEIFEGTKIKYKSKENKVFILAGGLGRRLEPFTNILPKPLIPFGDKPILLAIMDEFKKYGFNKYIISLNYKAEMIKLFLNDPDLQDKNYKIEYVVEDKPLGTIGSLEIAKELIDDTFVISNSDILVKEDMERIFNFHEEEGAVLTIVGCVKKTVLPYGVLKLDEKGCLIEIKEKPTYKNFINTGVYIASKEIINYIEPDTKIDMTDIINMLCKENKKIATFLITDDKWIDVGQWEEYKKAKTILGH